MARRWLEMPFRIPPGSMDICPLWMFCVVKVEVSAAGQSLVQGSTTEFVCVIECDQVQQ
jgi:hypothetical protein